MTNIELPSLPRQAELAIFRALILATSSAVYIENYKKRTHPAALNGYPFFAMKPAEFCTSRPELAHCGAGFILIESAIACSSGFQTKGFR